MWRRGLHSRCSVLLLLTGCGNDANPATTHEDGPDVAADSTDVSADEDSGSTEDSTNVPSRGEGGAGGDAESSDQASPTASSGGTGGDAESSDQALPTASTGDAGSAMPGVPGPGGPSGTGDAGREAPRACTDHFEVMPSAPSELASSSNSSARLLPLRDGRVVGLGSYASLGAVYDPDRNEWTSLPEYNVRVSNVDVVGDFIVVWPGIVDDGAIFDVTRNSWSTVPPAPFPEVLTEEGGDVVAGQYVRFVSNFGEVEFETGSRFDPEQNEWFEIGGSGPAFRRLGFVSIPTEIGLFVWGGAQRLTGDVGEATELPLLGDGARLDTETWTWQSINAEGAPSPRSTPVSVWTGEELIIYGGFAQVELSSAHHEPLNDGHRYNPATDTWTPLAGPGPLLHSSASAAWTGSQLLVWGLSEDPGVWVGGVYDLETASWTDLQFPDAFPLTRGRVYTTNDGQVVAFAQSGKLPDTVFVYDPNDTGWRGYPTGVDLEPRADVEAVWASDRLVLWGGYTSYEPPGQCENVPDDLGCDLLTEYTSLLDGVVFRPCPG
jgi:hypothetical protein